MRRKCSTVGIILLFICVIVVPNINQSGVKASQNNDLVEDEKLNVTHGTHLLDYSPFPPPIITFPSCISIKYDEEYVYQTEFIPDIAYLIKFTIGYKVGVPRLLLSSHSDGYLIVLLKHWIVFGSLVVYPMMINVSIENVPNWAEIYVVTPTVYISKYSNEFVTTFCDIVVTIHDEAPSEPFTFTIHAQSLQVHRIQGYSYSRNITITSQ